MDTDPRPARITADDSELARLVKAAIIQSPHRNLKNFDLAAGFGHGTLTVFTRSPLRLSPERRRAVMVALERMVGLSADRLAALAGLPPDGTVVRTDAPRSIEGLTPQQSAVAAAFRALVGCRPWPGLTPDRPTWATWCADLRRAWLALRAADDAFAATHPRAQLPSFAVWRIVIDGDKPGWSRPDGDEDLAALERAALAAGLEALADLRGHNDHSDPIAEIPANEGNQCDGEGLLKSEETPRHGAGLLKSEHTPSDPCHGETGVLAAVAKITPEIQGVKGKRGETRP